MHHVTIINNVLFAFKPELARRFAGRFAVVRDIISIDALDVIRELGDVAFDGLDDLGVGQQFQPGGFLRPHGHQLIPACVKIV